MRKKLGRGFPAWINLRVYPLPPRTLNFNPKGTRLATSKGTSSSPVLSLSFVFYFDYSLIDIINPPMANRIIFELSCI